MKRLRIIYDDYVFKPASIIARNLRAYLHNRYYAKYLGLLRVENP